MDEDASVYGSEASGRRRSSIPSIRSSVSRQPSEHSMRSRTVTDSRGDDDELRSVSLNDKRSRLSSSVRGSQSGSFSGDNRYEDDQEPSRRDRSSGFLAACCPCLRRKRDKDEDDEDIEMEDMRSDPKVDTDSLRTGTEDYRTQTYRSMDGR